MALTRVHTDLIEGSLGGDASEELQVDTFTGDGTTVTFGLTRLPDHANNTQIYISGVYQQKDTYTVSGLNLTFSEAPAIGESIEAVVAYVNPMYSGDHVKKSGDTMTGDLIFQRGGSTVGSIAAGSGVMAITGPSGNGLSFPNNLVLPSTSTAGSKDASTDLGVSYSRFKDLHLSGGVYLGGTGSANKLEDVESGTFAPIVYGSTTEGTTNYIQHQGFYEKVGRVVNIMVTLGVTSMTGTGGMIISGLPFAARSDSGYEALGSIMYNNFDTADASQLTAYLSAGQVKLNIFQSSDSAAWGVSWCQNDWAMRLTITYQTDA